jgi:hypothetical protein
MGGTPSLGLTPHPHIVGTIFPYIPFIFSARKNFFQNENLRMSAFGTKQT